MERLQSRGVAVFDLSEKKKLSDGWKKYEELWEPIRFELLERLNAWDAALGKDLERSFPEKDIQRALTMMRVPEHSNVRTALADTFTKFERVGKAVDALRDATHAIRNEIAGHSTAAVEPDTLDAMISAIDDLQAAAAAYRAALAGFKKAYVTVVATLPAERQKQFPSFEDQLALPEVVNSHRGRRSITESSGALVSHTKSEGFSRALRSKYRPLAEKLARFRAFADAVTETKHTIDMSKSKLQNLGSVNNDNLHGLEKLLSYAKRNKHVFLQGTGKDKRPIRRFYESVGDGQELPLEKISPHMIKRIKDCIMQSDRPDMKHEDRARINLSKIDLSYTLRTHKRLVKFLQESIARHKKFERTLKEIQGQGWRNADPATRSRKAAPMRLLVLKQSRK